MIAKSTEGHRLLCLLCILGGPLLMAPPAGAGGFEYGLEGAETVARAGANTAKVSGPEALYLNVAGISKEGGVKILIDANFISAKMTANLYGNGEDSWGGVAGAAGAIPYVPVENMTDIYTAGFKMFPAPIAGITFPIPQFKKLTLGLAILTPAALGSYQFPNTVQVDFGGSTYTLPSPQRYDIIEEDVLFLWPTIAASYRLTEKLSLGAGFQWGIIHLVFKTAINNGTVSSPRSYMNDTISTLDAWDYFVPAGILGLSWSPMDRIEFGFGMRISDKINAKGKVTAVANPWGSDPIYSDDPTLTWMDVEPYRRPKGALSFSWPTTVLRFGIRYKHPKKNAPTVQGRSLYPWEAELFDLELDFFVEQNHVVDDMKIQIDGYIPYGREAGQASPFKPESEGVVGSRRNWRDVISVRLGGSVNLFKGMLTLNLGGFYESPTVYDEDTRLDYLDNERFGVACGLQGRFFSFPVRKNHIGIELSISYAHFFFNKFSVREGKIRHIAFIGDTGTVVNNGDYEFAMDILTAGIRLTIL